MLRCRPQGPLSIRVVAVLLVPLLLDGGCHLVFPFSVHGPTNDGWVESVQVDGGMVPDRTATKPDATKPDATKPPPQCALYVNDAVTSGDKFTTAKGLNTNQGNKDHPFATLAYAISVAAPGAVICVDTGAYPGDLPISQSVTILGVNQGVTACNRAVAESTIQGFVDVAATAASVTLDGVKLERIPLPNLWNGANLRFLASTFRLLNSRVVPSAKTAGTGYGQTGYVAAPHKTVLSTVELRNNEFQPLFNVAGVSAVAIPAVTVSGTVDVSNNCFTDSGDNCNKSDEATVVIYGDINQVKMDANQITNSPTGGAGGVVVGAFIMPAVIQTLSVTNNRILHACGDGLQIDQTVASLTVTGNEIRASGTVQPASANLRAASAALLTKVSITNNDLAAPTSTTASKSVINQLTGATLPAPCNWFGVTTSAAVKPLLSGSVNYTPFLTDGDSDLAAPGFQPASASCNGK